MARGITVPEDVKHLIAKIYLEHPSWPAWKVREGLLTYLHKYKEFQKYVPDPEWPRLSRVQKELRYLKECDEARSAESKELDRPWRVLDIAKYPIPPVVLPTVLRAWGRQLEDDPNCPLDQSPITIREALWIARLYYLVKEAQLNVPILFLHDKGDEYYKDREEAAFIDNLCFLAPVYATHEIILEITGEHPETPEDMWRTWWNDGWLHEAMTGQSDVWQKCKKEIRKRFPDGFPLEDIKEAHRRTYRYKEASK